MIAIREYTAVRTTGWTGMDEWINGTHATAKDPTWGSSRTACGVGVPGHTVTEHEAPGVTVEWLTRESDITCPACPYLITKSMARW